MEKIGLYMQLACSMLALLGIASLIMVNILRGCLSGAGLIVALAILYLMGSLTWNAWMEVKHADKS